MRTSSGAQTDPDRDPWTLEEAGTLLQAAEETLRPGGLGLTEYALECCNLPDGSRVLDAGCGTAATARHLLNSGRLDAVGVDRSHSLLAEGRRLCSQVPLVCADLERLPFADGSFDALVCECVLSQTDAPLVLSRFRRVLRPGGYLVVTDLYRRGATPGTAPDANGAGQGAGSAANRVATREETLEELSAAGFESVLWEDRTEDLKRLALRLIMAPETKGLSDVFGWCRQTGCLSQPEAREWWKGVGYHLIIARR